MLDLLFFNDLELQGEELYESATIVSFTSDGFRELIESGFFELSTTAIQDGYCVDLTEYCTEVGKIFNEYPVNHTRLELLEALESHSFATADV